MLGLFLDSAICKAIMSAYLCNSALAHRLRAALSGPGPGRFYHCVHTAKLVRLANDRQTACEACMTPVNHHTQYIKRNMQYLRVLSLRCSANCQIRSTLGPLRNTRYASTSLYQSLK